MRERQLILAVAALGLLACPTRAKYDRLPTLRLTSPAAETYANRTVRIAVQVDHDVDLPIAVWANQNYLGSVSAPDYRLDWDTTTFAEAPYEVVAKMDVGAATVTSDKVRVIVDRTGPTVVSRATLQYEGGTKLSAPARVVFSEPLATASVTTASFSLASNGDEIPFAIALASDKKSMSITITDRSMLTLPVRIDATFLSGITDLAGNALVIPATPWTWSAPATFSYAFNGNRPYRVPTLAIRPELEPCVAYSGSVSLQNPASVLNVAMMDGALGWVNLPPPSSREFGIELDPDIVVDDEGHPIVAWQEDGAMRVAIWNGTAWDTPLPPVDGDGKPSTLATWKPRLALGPTGRIFIAWTEDTGTGADIYVAGANASSWDKSFGSLGLPVLGGSAVLRELAVDSNNVPRVAWDGEGVAGGVSVWRGTSWSTSRPPSTLARISTSLDEGGAFLALQGRPALTVVRLIEDEWQPAFPPFTTETFAFASMGTGPDHRPAVAWVDDATGVLSLGRWAGNSWDMRAGEAIQELPSGKGDSLMQVDSQGNMWVRWISFPVVHIRMSNY
jgi:hypothetical protein